MDEEYAFQVMLNIPSEKVQIPVFKDKAHEIIEADEELKIIPGAIQRCKKSLLFPDYTAANIQACPMGNFGEEN